MVVWFSNGKVMLLGGQFEYQTFWTINRLFYCPYFRPPFEYQTFWQPDTNLPFQYRISLVLRWLLLSSILISVVLQVDFLNHCNSYCFLGGVKSNSAIWTQWLSIFWSVQRRFIRQPSRPHGGWHWTASARYTIADHGLLMCAYLVVFEQFFKNRTAMFLDAIQKPNYLVRYSNARIFHVISSTVL